MENFLEYIGATVLVIMMVFIISIASGTILWIIYPHIHALFPSAAEKGILALDLKWWDAVCITWIFSILLKSSITNKED